MEGITLWNVSSNLKNWIIEHLKRISLNKAIDLEERLQIVNKELLILIHVNLLHSIKIKLKWVAQMLMADFHFRLLNQFKKIWPIYWLTLANSNIFKITIKILNWLLRVKLAHKTKLINKNNIVKDNQLHVSTITDLKPSQHK